MDELDNLMDLMELMDGFCIRVGDAKVRMKNEYPDLSAENLPRPPEVIKRDINKAKNGLEARTLNKELNDSYKYYNGLSREARNKIEREQKLINRIHSELSDLREFMDNEEYQTVFDEEYKMAKAEETKKDLEKWFNNDIKFKFKEEV